MWALDKCYFLKNTFFNNKEDGAYSYIQEPFFHAESSMEDFFPKL